MSKVDKLWAYAEERERVRKAREAGKPEPWTNDKPLRKFHFPNVHRLDDKGTRYIIELAERLREAGTLREPIDWLWLVYCYRSLNNQKTSERHGLPARNAKSMRAWISKMKADLDAGVPVGSGKHMTAWARTEEALPKVLAAKELADQVLAAPDGVEASRLLMGAGIACGPFIATQIVADLAEMGCAAFGPDTEVILGNGSLKGYVLATGKTPGRREEAREAVKALLASRPPSLKRLSFIDLEHLLCEFFRHTAITAWLRGQRGKPKYSLRSVPPEQLKLDLEEARS